ncbi:hypothetical protein GNI_034740 [Gregarina niphandrodes]|uniref:Uncharacterized protein n=1 Tax=Gregarina niphandrodes TaxID=110365 RepID=A0A023BB16_GRENI|nr:hypothetical protein GNI_034740 [Gregarina niphandrodes]EZG78561.1 hypothetical protein GNI_034740 [Gregarina niphandrodes]|eukprot:XP_011129247.1 hypothetical protein GNI_034740 [Gregarina niphandrodes]
MWGAKSSSSPILQEFLVAIGAVIPGLSSLEEMSESQQDLVDLYGKMREVVSSEYGEDQVMRVALSWKGNPWEDSVQTNWLKEVIDPPEAILKNLDMRDDYREWDLESSQIRALMDLWLPWVPFHVGVENFIRMTQAVEGSTTRTSADVQLDDGTIVSVKPYKHVEHPWWRDDAKSLAWRVTTPNNIQYHSSSRLSRFTENDEHDETNDDSRHMRTSVCLDEVEWLHSILGSYRYEQFANRFLRLIIDHGCSGFFTDGHAFNLVQGSQGLQWQTDIWIQEGDAQWPGRMQRDALDVLRTAFNGGPL